MNRHTFVDQILHGGNRSPQASLLRCVLTPLSWLHHVGLQAYLLPYRTGVRRRFRLRSSDGRPVPVVAIGNLSSGGTGKTPMAALVASRLQATGRRVVVLSRGYRGAGGAKPRVVSDGSRTLLPPSDSGDEPALLARLLPEVPVVVGKDRRQSGRLAVDQFAPDVLVLDDALQFWQLHRDLDIVLLDAARPFDNGHILPRGLLREPPSHLRRARIVILTRADRVDSDALQATRAKVAALAPAATIFSGCHAPICWIRASDDVPLPTTHLEGRDVCAFAGIGDFGSFVRTVESLGAGTVGVRDFGDHHDYAATELAPLVAAECDAAVTTEKDLVKVGPLWPHHAGSPLYALRIGMKLDDPGSFMEIVASVCRR